MIIRSLEGIGKTTGLLEELALDIFDAAVSRSPDGKEQFACLACRSIEQAEAKAAEYRNSGPDRGGVVVMSFWEHYRLACGANGVTPIEQHRFPDHSINGVLRHIEKEQPNVFDALEARRRALWIGPDGKNLFDSGVTILATSHALAKGWHRNHVTRTWHNPDFVPFANQDHETLRANLSVFEIVIDEPELDVVLNIIPEWQFDCLKRMKRKHRGWSSKNRKERHKIYQLEKAANEIPGNLSFEEFDELIRLNLDDLHPQEVSYDALPFGFDQKGTGIYSVKAGKLFYLGVQDWIRNTNARLTFLTTETLITNVLIEAYHKVPARNPIVLDLYAPSGLFPIEVPLFTDRRSAKRNIGPFVDEILAANPNAVIIANGTNSAHPRVLNFQRAKGVNGLDEKDVFIIGTCLAPDRYAELNVIGQWLNLPGIIRQQYEDEISQAVGRNTGFRQSEKPTKTVVICPHRLYKNTLKDCFRDDSARVRLQKVKERPW